MQCNVCCDPHRGAVPRTGGWWDIGLGVLALLLRPRELILHVFSASHGGTPHGSESDTVEVFATNQGFLPRQPARCQQPSDPCLGPGTQATVWKAEPKAGRPGPESGCSWSWTCLYTLQLIKRTLLFQPVWVVFSVPDNYKVADINFIFNMQQTDGLKNASLQNFVNGSPLPWEEYSILPWHPPFLTICLHVLSLASDEGILGSRLIGLLNCSQQLILPHLCAFAHSVPSAWNTLSFSVSTPLPLLPGRQLPPPAFTFPSA